MNKLIFTACLAIICTTVSAQVKNGMTEAIEYRQVDGKIIIPAMVNGISAEFVLDLAGGNAILPEYAGIFGVDRSKTGKPGNDGFVFKDVPVEKGKIVLDNISIGNGVAELNKSVYILAEGDYLRKLGVAGVLNGTLFRTSVLTIDASRQRITMTSPYKPDYMQLKMRTQAEIIEAGLGIMCPVTLDGQELELLLDTWDSGTATLTAEDFGKLHGVQAEALTGRGYGPADMKVPGKTVAAASFVKTDMGPVTVAECAGATRSRLGTGILEHGILSVDYLNSRIYFQPFDMVEVPDEIRSEKIVAQAGKLNAINRNYFVDNVYDYRKDKEFVFKGDIPVVIDFWATWCGPCMKLLPQMEKMAEKYNGQVLFLKVDADKEKELCNVFGIRALPTIMMIRAGSPPIFHTGALPEQIEAIIREKLLELQ